MQAITEKTNNSAGATHPTFDYTCDRASRIGYRGGIALTTYICCGATRPAGPGFSHSSTCSPDRRDSTWLLPARPYRAAFSKPSRNTASRLSAIPSLLRSTKGGRTVQYFERVKMEYHPELAAQGAPVLFTRLGADISAGISSATVKPFATVAFKTYFAQTGHSLAEPFLSFWRNNGDVNLFGYPISEVIWQDGMQVQWFERARMEYHPELAAQGYAVQLTLLGTMAYTRAYNRRPLQLNSPSLVTMNSMEATCSQVSTPSVPLWAWPPCP